MSPKPQRHFDSFSHLILRFHFHRNDAHKRNGFGQLQERIARIFKRRTKVHLGFGRFGMTDRSAARFHLSLSEKVCL